MNDFIKKFLYLDFTTEEIDSITDDILEENRKCIILYSAIVSIGMGILLILSFFIDQLVSSRNAYIGAVGVCVVLNIIAYFPAKKFSGLTVLCKYILVSLLLCFGIVLGTVVDPNQASASFAVLLFVVPLLFTDLPYKINSITILSIIIYIFAAKETQSASMFSFNMSVVLPYGIANLVLTHFTSKMKIERFVYAHEKKMMGEYDRLTGLLNRWSFEKDEEHLMNSEDIRGDIAICSLDVNHLKTVNDNFGHKAGDDLIIAAADAISKIFGKYGKCYRVGGDEFMAVITGVFPSADELKNMLEKETSFYHNDLYDFGLSISCGIAQGNKKDIENLITEADRLMYEHKNDYYVISGKDRRKSRN